MVNIKVKVKTIDCGDKLITVDDELSLSDFRTHVEDVTSITRERQRIIFCGRALVDETKTLRAYGIENEMAVHVVNRLSPPSAPTNPPQQNDTEIPTRNSDQQYHHAQTNNHNVIFGTIPLERTPFLNDSFQSITLIRSLLNDLQPTYDITSEVTLRNNQETEDTYTLSVILRGPYLTTAESPAREQFDQLCIDFKKLVWMVATIKILFIDHLNNFFDNNLCEPSQDIAFEILAGILQGMHALDALNVDDLRALYTQSNNENDELLRLSEDIDTWILADDDEHNQRLENNIIMRHFVASDLVLFIRRLRIVDEHINGVLTNNYLRVLEIQHNYEIGSYPSRLLNCFTSAYSRIQHFRAHIYHNFSDFGIHADSNPTNRVYPQYIVYERDAPPEAHINIVFNRRGESTSANVSTRSNTNSAQSENPGDRVLFSIQQFLSRAGEPIVSQASTQNNRVPIATPTSLTIPLNIGRNNNFTGSVAGIGLQNFRSSFLSTRPFQRTIPQSRFNNPRGFLGPVGIPVGGLRITGGLEPQQPSNTSTRSSNDEPMDTSTTTGSQTTNNSNQNNTNHPQSLNLGQALSEFMTLASQYSSSETPLNVRSTLAQSNRSYPVLNLQSRSEALPRSNSATRLPAISDNSQATLGSMRLPPNTVPAQAPRFVPSSNNGNDTTSSSLIGWRQMSSDSVNALFIGPRPPANMPLYTNDPFLPCSSRRIQNFELDARHNDFWNDPITIASGRTLRRIPNNNNFSQGSSFRNTYRSNEYPNADISVNENGEAIFHNEQNFCDYIRCTLEQIMVGMCEFSATSNALLQPTPQINSSSESQIYGFTPLMGRQILIGGGSNPTDNLAGSAFEGIISITAEIPITSNTITNNSGAVTQVNSSLNSSTNTSSQGTTTGGGTRLSDFTNDLDEMD